MATLSPKLRKLTLTAHVMSSVGWLGAVVAYLALALAGLKSQDPQLARAAYLSLEVLGWLVIVPLSLATLGTGLIQSLGTEWGLIRYYWILVKFVLTVGGTTILLLHVPAVSRMAGVAAAAGAFSLADHIPARLQLVVHASGGLVILMTATVLSIYKPWGKTAYGRRASVSPSGAIVGAEVEAGLNSRLYISLAIAGFLLLLALMHLAGARPHGH